MSNHEKITQRPVQSKNEQTITNIVKSIKSFFQGKPVTVTPVYTHPTYLNRNKCVTINVNELSQEARQSYDELFDRIFSNPKLLKN